MFIFIYNFKVEGNKVQNWDKNFWFSIEILPESSWEYFQLFLNIANKQFS